MTAEPSGQTGPSGGLQAVSSPTDYGPLPPPASGEQPAGAVGATGSEAKQADDPSGSRKEFVLVLGPGLARALSYVGVIRELEAAGYKFSGFVGVEMGAFLAAIYSAHGLNALEWETHKLKKEHFSDVPLFRFRKLELAEGKRLTAFIASALSGATFSSLRAPLMIGTALNGPEGAVPRFFRDGALAELLRAAMAVQDLVAPSSVGSEEYLSLSTIVPFPAKIAKDLSWGRSLCVHAIGAGDDFEAKDDREIILRTQMKAVAALAEYQVRDCDKVIRVDTRGIGYLAFDKKAEAISRGRAAAIAWISEEQK